MDNAMHKTPERQPHDQHPDFSPLHKMAGTFSLALLQNTASLRIPEAQKTTGPGEIERMRLLVTRHAEEKDTWRRTMGAGLSLLKQTSEMHQAALDRIRTLEQDLEHLNRFSTADPVTGLANRRGFIETFLRELDRANRGLGTGGLLIMVDLENYAQIALRFGEAAKDAFACLVGNTLRGETRIMDLVTRFAEDEFILMLAGISRKEAAARAQSLAWSLNHLSMDWAGEKLPVHVSISLRPYGAGDRPERILRGVRPDEIESLLSLSLSSFSPSNPQNGAAHETA